MAPLRIPDLVQAAKIDTVFLDGLELARHTRTKVGSSARKRQLRTEETWKRKHRLGSGSFGTVWLEECIEGEVKDRVRAVKQVQKTQSIPTEYLYRELETIAKFSHDNYAHCFVRSTGWYENDTHIFISMEYLKYGDLQTHLSKGKPLAEPESTQISLQLAEGLDLFHQAGFAHRDLKPSNILVFHPGPAWWVKIGDFGISKRTEDTVLKTSRIGTSGYMAPELMHLYPPSEPYLEETFAYTASVDMWALGEIAYRMLTCQPTFSGRGLYDYVIMGSAFPTRVLEEAKCSQSGIDFIQTCMAASPKDRLSSQQALEHSWLTNHIPIEEDDDDDQAELSQPLANPVEDESQPEYSELSRNHWSARWSSQPVTYSDEGPTATTSSTVNPEDDDHLNPSTFPKKPRESVHLLNPEDEKLSSEETLKQAPVKEEKVVEVISLGQKRQFPEDRQMVHPNEYRENEETRDQVVPKQKKPTPVVQRNQTKINSEARPLALTNAPLKGNVDWDRIDPAYISSHNDHTCHVPGCGYRKENWDFGSSERLLQHYKDLHPKVFNQRVARNPKRPAVAKSQPSSKPKQDPKVNDEWKSVDPRYIPSGNNNYFCSIPACGYNKQGWDFGSSMALLQHYKDLHPKVVKKRRPNKVPEVRSPPASSLSTGGNRVPPNPNAQVVHSSRPVISSPPQPPKWDKNLCCPVKKCGWAQVSFGNKDTLVGHIQAMHPDSSRTLLIKVHMRRLFSFT